MLTFSTFYKAVLLKLCYSLQLPGELFMKSWYLCHISCKLNQNLWGGGPQISDWKTKSSSGASRHDLITLTCTSQTNMPKNHQGLGSGDEVLSKCRFWFRRSGLLVRDTAVLTHSQWWWFGLSTDHDLTREAVSFQTYTSPWLALWGQVPQSLSVITWPEPCFFDL